MAPPTEAEIAKVDVFVDARRVGTTANDGAGAVSLNGKGGGSHAVKVCEAGTATCSGDVAVSY